MNEDIEQLGLEADRIDNLLAACELPLPARFHLAQVKSFLPDISAAIKRYVVKASGENPWL